MPPHSNVKLQHLLNDCGVSLGKAPVQLVTLTRCTFIFRSEKKGRELLRPHRLSINFKGKNRVLKVATPWSGTGQVQEAKSTTETISRASSPPWDLGAWACLETNRAGRAAQLQAFRANVTESLENTFQTNHSNASKDDWLVQKTQ